MKESNEEIKKKIESILFAAGKKIELAEIAKLCRLSHNIGLVESLLGELKEKYSKEDSSLMLAREGSAWKLTVREKYAQVVENIVTQSELSKSIMETLAVIAYKAPVLQSEIIKIRTNKAYDHLRELESSGYISRKKKGRTKLIELSPLFFEYFDVPPEKLREKFRTVEELEKAVEVKESEAAGAKEEFGEKKSRAKKEESKIKLEIEAEIQGLDSSITKKEEKLPEIDLIGKKGGRKKLAVYDSEIAEGTEFEEPKSNIEVVGDRIGSLDIVDIGLPPSEKNELVKEAELMKMQDLAEAGKKEEESASKSAEGENGDGENFKLPAEGEEERVEEERVEEERVEEYAGQFPENIQESSEVGEYPEKPSGAEGPSGAEKVSGAEEQGEEGGSSEEPNNEEAAEEPELNEKEEDSERITESSISAEAANQMQNQPVKQKEGKRLFEKGVPDNVQKMIDSKVDEIVFGKKQAPENKGESEGEKESGKDGSEDENLSEGF